MRQKYGSKTYIDILRKSNNKKNTPDMKKGEYYGKGSHKSIAWWKELIDKLIDLGYLQTIYINNGNFPIPLLGTTQRGVMWTNMSGLSKILSIPDTDNIGYIHMTNAV